MSISFECPTCRTMRTASRALSGHRVRCPECGAVSEIPYNLLTEEEEKAQRVAGMSARRMLERLEELGWLEEKVLAEVRAQVADQKLRVTAELVAKTLVEKGHLTKFQATKLVGEVAGDRDAAKAKPRVGEKDVHTSSADSDDSLGFAAIDETSKNGDLELQIVQEPDELEIVREPEPSKPKASPTQTSKQKTETSSLKPATPGNRPSRPKEPVATHSALPPDSGLTPIGNIHDEAIALGSGEPVPGLTPMAPASQSGFQDIFGGGSQAGPSNDPFGLNSGFGPPTTPVTKSKPAHNPWDSAKTYIAGVGLVLLIGAVYFLASSLLRGNADTAYTHAEELYKAGSYSEAVKAYDSFANSFSGHENASLAKVKSAFSKVRQAMQNSRDDQPIKAAKEALPGVEKEAAFKDARLELGIILPEMAASYSSRAKSTKEVDKIQQLVEYSEEALRLVNNPTYIPPANRKTHEGKISTIQEDISQARKEIQREKQRVESLAEISAAMSQGKTEEAFAAYRQLVAEHPGLETNAEVREAVLAISKKEQELIKVATPNPLEPIPATKGSDLSVILAHRAAGQIPGATDRAAVYLVRGTVYGINVADGRVLWRRYMGSDTQIDPIPFTSAPNSDVLLVNESKNQLTRVKRATGEIVWQSAIGAPFSAPVVSGDRIFVPIESGVLLVLDGQSGEAKRSATFPQRITVAPVVSGDGLQLFQLGDRSNIYLFAGDTLECKDVYYLGHKSGSVATPPIYVQGYLLAFANSGQDACNLFAFTAKAGQPIARVQNPIRLQGNVVSPPIFSGRRAVVTTNVGAIYVLDVDAAADANPVSVVANLPKSSESVSVSYAVLDQTRLWTADSRFTRYDLQVTRGKLSRLWVVDEGDPFVGPLQRFDTVILSARRPRGSAAVAISAVHADSHQRLWQVELGVPASHIAVDTEKSSLQVITANAGRFDINKDVLSKGYNDQPAKPAGIPPNMAFTESVTLSNGRALLYDPVEATRILFFDPRSSGSGLNLQQRTPEMGKISARPTPFVSGVLVPSDNGVVYLLNSQSGDDLALPFQPARDSTDPVAWRRPAVLDGVNEFMIVDHRQNLYRVGIKRDPQPHLDAISHTPCEVKFESDLASLGKWLFGVVRGNPGDTVIAMSIDDPQKFQEIALEGKAVWGPERVGDLIVLQSDKEGIVCLDATPARKWNFELPENDRLAGRPIEIGTELCIASTRGRIWRLSRESGTAIGELALEQPLAASPAMFGSRMLLCGADGTLHVVTPPSQP